MLRTGPGSRVAIQLIDESQLKINANSRLELKQVTPRVGGMVPVTARVLRTMLRLFSGEIWLRSYEEPVEIETLVATATIRGTELNLAIGTDNLSRLAVLEGVVEFRNPQGSVLVAAGEQATAKLGEAPRKTVLLHPLDAVQWSLYYPGIVSYRDYPLSGIPPPLLRERLAEVERRVESRPQDVNAIIELGEILFDLGRRTEARKGFEKALTLAPDNPRARADLGWVYLEQNEVQAALGQFRQAQPPTLEALVGMINALYRLDRFEEALKVIAETQRRFPRSPMPWVEAALIHLLQGRVAEAQADLNRALALDPRYALAYGLRSNIYLVQNQKERALEAAQQAIAANPYSPSAYLDLSLVKQAEFQLEEALQAARKAVELDPENAQALIQEARLLFGMGRIKDAFKLAQQARQRAPDDPLVNSTWGFLQLAQDHVSKAIAAFDQAIAQDSTRGEPHLGRGLAMFRRGKKLDEAVQEMGIATLLEPRVSLFHSYLGKAFYEVKRERLAQRELALAKELDPRDPTPYLYDAILKESVNRVVEAVQDLQKSVALNNNRGVYRSRFLLDQDLAARGAVLGQIYNELGFQQLALVEGWKSVNTDPTNYSAHRLLADTYSALPRHEIARVSELLQSQLLQPINITPLQPQLAEGKLFILEGAGPTHISLSEFNPLFLRNRLALLASGAIGNNSIFGDEVIQSGIWRNLSWSLGQFHYETDGFRENNDLKHDIYNAFVQVSPSYTTSVQAEIRHADTKSGDITLNFDPDNFFRTRRRAIETDTFRLGFRYSPTEHSNFITSFIVLDRELDLSLTREPRGTSFITRSDDFDTKGYNVEGQYLFGGTQRFNLITGAGYYDDASDSSSDTTLEITPTLCPFPPCTISDSFKGKLDTQHTNAYVYSLINFPANISWTLGASVDFFDSSAFDRDQINPKLGLIWNPIPSTTVRLAWFRMLKRLLVSNQTIEPTQVAGFNQFFDDFNGTDSTRYGIAIDQKFLPALFSGLESSKRDLNVPILNEKLLLKRKEDWDEQLHRAYLYWTPNVNIALSAEYQFEELEREFVPDSAFPFDKVQTHRVPLAFNAFHPNGLFLNLKATYIDQEVEFRDSKGNVDMDTDAFWVTDLSVGYRLPKRWGFLSFTMINLFNEDFRFQDTDFAGDPRIPFLQPERTFFGRLTLFF